MRKKIKYLLFVILLFVSCSPLQKISVSSQLIPVDSLIKGNSEIHRFVATYKDSLQGIVNECIGFNNQLMVADKPESLLTNFVSDLMLSEAGIIADSLGISVPDLAIMNVYGLRDVLPQGDVTVGTIFRVMPFENKLVFVKMTGDNLNLLLNHIASKGGEGMSGISFGIKDRKAVQVMVQGKPLDPGKIYVLAVSDYLANGGGGLELLKNVIWRKDTPILIRDIIMVYVRKQTLAGHNLIVKTDNRIYNVE